MDIEQGKMFHYFRNIFQQGILGNYFNHLHYFDTFLEGIL